MSSSFDDKVILVTGAASGFGAATVRQAVAAGAKVVCVDINGEGAEAIATELGDQAVAAVADVSDGAAVAAAVARGVEAFGRIDVVVNNAGISHRNRPAPRGR